LETGITKKSSIYKPNFLKKLGLFKAGFI